MKKNFHFLLKKCEKKKRKKKPKKQRKSKRRKSRKNSEISWGLVKFYLSTAVKSSSYGSTVQIL